MIKNTYKNRHIKKEKEEESEYIFPNTSRPFTRFCTVDEILFEFFRVGKKDCNNKNHQESK